MSVPDHIKDYIAPAGVSKCYVDKPCAVCGWNKEEAIHTNPQLIGRGGPYHEYEPMPGRMDHE
jgi:hypothetical protein